MTTTSPFSRPRRLVALSAIAVMAATLPAGATSLRAAAAPVPTQTLGADDFNRSLSAGWGSAPSGGAWVSTPSGSSSVKSGAGQVTLASGRSVYHSLPVSVADVRATMITRVERLPVSGNGVTTSVSVRGSSAGKYTATLRVGKSGRVALGLVRQRTGQPDAVLANEVLLPTAAAAGAAYSVQVEVTGSSPVRIVARGWRSSTAIPAWQLVRQDSTPSRLAAAGRLDLRTYLSASTPRMNASYDNVRVQRVAEASPTTIAPPPPPTTRTPTGAGSAVVGSTRYPIPGGAVFVAARNSRSGAGTQASPYGSLAYALERAPSGSTLVLRGGNYHESATVPFHRRLTIQSYPGEAVWLDGSSKVTGWVKSGSTWVVNGWNHIFDHRVSHSQGVDESRRFIDPAYPLAGYPDQVWIAGVKMKQVGSTAAVVPGTFFVDVTNRRLVIGNDPTGKPVEASTLQQGLVIQGEGTTVRGIGARRYANTFWMGGAISAQVNLITLENVVCADNATIGLNGWGKSMRFNRLTLSGNGVMGLGLNTANNLVLSDSLIRANNLERFKEAPVSGGAKITTSRDVVIKNNIFDQNTTAGLWFDESAYNLTITGNRVNNNGGTGIALELSSKVVVANNYFVNNGKAGVEVGDTNNVAVWNNTFSGNKLYTLRVYQDSRRSSDPVITYLVRDVSYRNNVLAYGTGNCPILVHDMQKRVSGQTMRVTLQSNAHHRASATAPANVSCWAAGTAGLSSYKTLTAFRSGTGNDLKSTLNQGASILTGSYQLTAAAARTTSGIALPLPSGVASAVGVASGTKKMGALTPMR